MSEKIYAVTGAANGIGRALAVMLDAAGHTVICLDVLRPEDAVGRYINLDLDDPQSIKQAVLDVPEGSDGLCNCAGLPPRPGLEAKILSVNFVGTRAFTAMVQHKLNKGGSVVNMALSKSSGLGSSPSRSWKSLSMLRVSIRFALTICQRKL